MLTSHLRPRCLVALALGGALAAATPAPAQSYVPADLVGRIDQADPPPPGRPADGSFSSGAVVVTGSQMEAALADLLLEYRDTGRAGVLRQSTVMVFPYGHSQPVLATAPLRASVIELEPGETVFGLAAGDTERFAYELSYTGPGGDTPIVLVKPLDYDVTTNLVVSTDRRIYHVTLDAAPSDDVLVQEDNPQGRYAPPHPVLLPRRGPRPARRWARGLGRARGPGPGRRARLALGPPLRVPGVRRPGGDGGRRARVRRRGPRLHRAHRRGPAERAGPRPLRPWPGRAAEVLNYVLRDGRYITDRTFESAELVLGATVRKGLFGLGGKRQVERRALIVRTDP